MSAHQDLAFSQILRQQQAALATHAAESRRRTIEELQNRLIAEESQPGNYIELAKYHMQSQQLETGIDVLQKGLQHCQPDEQLYYEAIFALEVANRTEEAISLARRAKGLFPHARYFELSEMLMLPVLYCSEEETEYYRVRYSSGLKALAAELKLETVEDRRRALEAVSKHLNFYLAYQGLDDRMLQEDYGRLVHRIMAANYPEWVKPLEMPPVPPGGKIRVGYISAHFREHSVLRMMLGWFREHNRQDFELFAYHNGTTVDAATDEVRRTCEHFRHIPGGV